MSVDISIGDDGCCYGHSFNLTYNYSPALRDAGAPAWKLMDGIQADVFAIIFSRVRSALMADRPRFEPLIKGGGTWGNWEHLLEVLKSILDVCEQHPQGRVSICG